MSYRTDTSRTLTGTDLMDFGNRIARLFRDAAWPWGIDGDQFEATAASWVPYADVVEDAEYYRVAVELPGVDREHVRLTIENNVLAVRGEKLIETTDDARIVHSERTVGMFERYFALPTTVDVDSINASYDNGVLTVSLAKAEAARTREIPVQAT